MNRLLIAAAAIVVLALVLAAAGGNDDVVRARELQLIDDAGNVRAEIAFEDGQPGLFIRDEAGVNRLEVSHGPEAKGISINDSSGSTRIGVVQFAHGGGGVALHGPDSKGAAVLYFKNQGSLRFFDSEGQVTREITATPASRDE